MVVHLQRQGATWLDHDAFDLKAGAGVHAVIPTPGSEHFTVDLPLRAPALLQRVHNFLDVLGMVLVRHQNGVRRFDHHQVRHTNTGDQTAVGQGQRVAAILQDHVTLRHVAGRVLGQHLPQCVPGTDVGPAGLQRNDCALRQRLPTRAAGRDAFHDRIVYRVARAGRKSVFVHPQKLAIALALIPRTRTGLENVGAAMLHRLQPHRGSHHEQAAIPQVRALRQVAARRLQVGFFDETRDTSGWPDCARVAMLMFR